MPKRRIIVHDNRSLSLTQWAREAGIRPQTLASRLDAGMPMGRALATGLRTREQAGREGRAASCWGVV